jgi:glutathionylspermidine synthase
MLRIPVNERPDLMRIASEHGLEYSAGTGTGTSTGDGDGITGWDESAYYQFTLRQIEEDLEAPAEELEGMCMEVVDRAVATESVLQRLEIPEHFWDYIAESWRSGEKNLYGRMDLSYDGKGPAKLLEYNADTPTALYETAVFQWEWFEQTTEMGLIPKGGDQLNDVHESIVDAFPLLGIEGVAHFACNNDIEDDKGTLQYLEECAQEAGVETCFLAMEEIGLNDHGQLTDLEDRAIRTLFKLYPWEWIMAEEFGAEVPNCGTRFIEPPWKAILSNKGLMPLLWGMFENHPNLLPAYFEDDPAAAELIDTGSYVRKPMLSRQGANIKIVQDGQTHFESDGPYSEDKHIIQGFQSLPEFEGRFPLVGCWLVASKAVGLCIREDKTLVTGKDSRCVPHVIAG